MQLCLIKIPATSKLTYPLNIRRRDPVMVYKGRTLAKIQLRGSGVYCIIVKIKGKLIMC